MSRHFADTARREFLRFLAASPCAAALGGVSGLIAPNAFAQSNVSIGMQNPADALTVFDFEDLARRNMLPGHWAYLASGVDADVTLRANREGFSQVQLRPRRLRDATKVDMRVELFGTTYASPIFTCPTGGEKSVHPDGELAVARAAKARGTMQMLATPTSIPVEDVNRALGRPAWFQLYAPASWDACKQLLRRVQASGCTVIALTVDNTTGRFSESYLRNRPRDLKPCLACHPKGPDVRDTVMLQGIDMQGGGRMNPAMDWGFVDRLRDFWPGKFVIKGIDSGEDAKLCVEHGVDGILVSNHGGRATDTGRSSIEALPEVVLAVHNRVPVFVDGGVRRGTDVFKALALGAKAVGIGRPFLWGLGAFGQAGVDRVLEILQAELKLAMGNCGTQTVADITAAYVATPSWKM
jgi:isopentenyl diphosphate isomerase/L-lactate dehydrogenase-like FMN-dependent dehydrogenase